MRIVYIGSFRLPNFDAAAARVLNVARALRLAGHEVNFISWGGKERECDLCHDGVFRIDGFVYEVTHELDPRGGIIKKLKGRLLRGYKTRSILCERLGQYDVIITYNGNMARWLVGFARRHNIKLISDLTEWYDNNELKVIDRLSYEYNMKLVQARIKNKIVISHYFNDYYRMTNNIVIPASCDATEAKWRQGVEAAKMKAGCFDGITLIYAGTPARKDVIHHAINAVQRLIDEGANIRFLIVGVERERYMQNYADLLLKKVLSGKIQFLGRVSQDEVPSYYALADFMVLLRELSRKSNAGFPTKFAESFTSGTPVIANLTSDLDMYLLDGLTGFVVTEPSEKCFYEVLKNKVIKLSSESIEQMKHNVRQEANRLDYHYFVEPLSKFMNELQ